MKKERKWIVQINCPTLMSGYEMTLICKRIHCLCVQLWLHKHKQVMHVFWLVPFLLKRHYAHPTSLDSATDSGLFLWGQWGATDILVVELELSGCHVAFHHLISHLGPSLLMLTDQLLQHGDQLLLQLTSEQLSTRVVLLDHKWQDSWVKNSRITRSKQ